MRLHMAQPPLSQQILHLEAELGTLLLKRTKRRVQLTEAGRVLLGEARATLAQADRAVRLAQRASRGEIGHLSVGFVPWADLTSVPRMIRTFGERHPEIDLELHNLTAPEQVTALRHRFTAYQRIPWRLLATEPYILFSPKQAPAYYAVIDHACREAGITLKIKREVDHPQTILALVEAGVGVSLVPASSAVATRPDIVHRRLRPAGPALKTVIAWRRNSELRLIELFLGVVREVLVANRKRSKVSKLPARNFSSQTLRIIVGPKGNWLRPSLGRCGSAELALWPSESVKAFQPSGRRLLRASNALRRTAPRVWPFAAVRAATMASADCCPHIVPAWRRSSLRGTRADLPG